MAEFIASIGFWLADETKGAFRKKAKTEMVSTKSKNSEDVPSSSKLVSAKTSSTTTKSSTRMNF